MIDEIRADARQFVPQCNAMALQLLARPDAGQQQQLRRAEDAGATGRLRDARRCARFRPALDLDARGAAPVEARCASHGSRSAPSGSAGRAPDAGMRRPRCSGGRGAASPGKGPRHPAVAPLKSRFGGKAGANRGFDESTRRGHRTREIRNRQLAADTVEMVRAALLVFGSAKHRQHVVVGPARDCRAPPSRRSRCDGRACRPSR